MFTRWMPHIHNVRLDRQMAKLQEERMVDVPEKTKDAFIARAKTERRDQALELARQIKAETEAQSEATRAAEVSEIAPDPTEDEIDAAVETLTVVYKKEEGARRARIFTRTKGRDLTEEETTRARDEAPEYPEYVYPVMLSKSDYAAYFETPRVFGATCGSREKHNCCITVTGYKPERKERSVKKWGSAQQG